MPLDDGFVTHAEPDAGAVAAPGAPWPDTRGEAERPLAAATAGSARVRLAAAAQQTECVRALLAFADGVAAAIALGVGVQFLAGATLRPAAILVPPLTVLIARVFDLYGTPGRGLGRSTLAEVPRLAQLATLLALLASFGGSRLVAGAWDVGTTAVLWASLLVALPVARGLARRLPATLAPERCLVIGSMARSARVRRTIHGLSSGRSLVVGWIVPEQVVPGVDGDARTLCEAVAYHRAEHVVVAPDVADSHETLVLIRALEELEVRVTVLPRLLELASITLTAEVIGGAAALDVRRLGLSRAERAIKRAVDICGAAALLVMAVPVGVAIALAVRLTSPGPIFFRQRRIGRDGRPFSMWKFRSMVRDAEARKRTCARATRRTGSSRSPTTRA